MVATVTRPGVTVMAMVSVCGNGNEAMTSSSSPASNRATRPADPAWVRTDAMVQPCRPTRVPWMGRPLPSRWTAGASVRSTLRPSTR